VVIKARSSGSTAYRVSFVTGGWVMAAGQTPKLVVTLSQAAALGVSLPLFWHVMVLYAGSVAAVLAARMAAQFCAWGASKRE